ncbi:MAG: AtzH-like domain-containing protein [bacterium]
MEIDLPEVMAEVDAAFMEYERARATNGVAALDRLLLDSRGRNSPRPREDPARAWRERGVRGRPRAHRSPRALRRIRATRARSTHRRRRLAACISRHARQHPRHAAAAIAAPSACESESEACGRRQGIDRGERRWRRAATGGTVSGRAPSITATIPRTIWVRCRHRSS